MRWKTKKNEMSLVKWNDWWLKQWKRRFKVPVKVHHEMMMTYSQTLRELSRKIKRLVNDMTMRGEIWYGDEMIAFAESGDQRSAKKNKRRLGGIRFVEEISF